ncbi:hypothetical protein A2U01_0073783, partial [Trifolium medium]|nr:hypothetical protein [Trifolium medium]
MEELEARINEAETLQDAGFGDAEEADNSLYVMFVIPIYFSYCLTI